MLFTIVLLIVLVVLVAAMVLSAQSDEERRNREAREREEAIEAHLRMVRAKYAESDPRQYGYRARHHADFYRRAAVKPFTACGN
jgi:type II secretory pathway pseudopilin PulG